MFNSAGTLLDSETVPVVRDGEFGKNAVRIDLDNEVDMVNTDSTGKVSVQRTIVTHATIYDGPTAASSVSVVSTAASLAIGGVTPTITVSGGTATISWVFTNTAVLTTAATVTVTMQYNGTNYPADFTVAPSLGGAIYKLNPSMSAVPFERDASGALTPASRNVGLTITKIDGASTAEYTTAASAGVTVRYSTSSMPSSPTAGTGWTSGTITVSNSVTMLYIAMFNAAGTLLDSETVPVVRDGESGVNAAVCYMDRAAAFIPTDADGKTLEAVRMMVGFKVMANNTVLGVKGATVNEGGTTHYVQLHGGKLANGSMSVSGTKVTIIGGTVSGTKVSLNSLYTAGPSAIIISIPKGAMLDEHSVSLTITAADIYGNEYTAYGSFEILAATQGADAINAIATPAALILNQSLTNPTNLSNLSEKIYFSVTKGEQQLSVTRVDVASASHCSASGSTSNYATITAIGTYRQDDADIYYDKADITCTITYLDNGVSRTISGIVVSIYANLMGTWKEKVEADTKTAIAQSTLTEFTGGSVVSDQRLGEFIASSQKYEVKLSSKVIDTDGNIITSEGSVYKQTSDAIIQRVGTAGITIESNTVTLDAAKVKINNGTTTAAMFEGGKIKGEYLKVTNLEAVSGAIGGFTISAHSIYSANNKIILNDDGTAVVGKMEVDGNGNITVTDAFISGHIIGPLVLSSTGHIQTRENGSRRLHIGSDGGGQIVGYADDIGGVAQPKLYLGVYNTGEPYVTLGANETMLGRKSLSLYNTNTDSNALLFTGVDSGLSLKHKGTTTYSEESDIALFTSDLGAGLSLKYRGASESESNTLKVEIQALSGGFIFSASKNNANAWITGPNDTVARNKGVPIGGVYLKTTTAGTVECLTVRMS